MRSGQVNVSPQPSLRLIAAGEMSDSFTDGLGLPFEGHLKGARTRTTSQDVQTARN